MLTMGRQCFDQILHLSPIDTFAYVPCPISFARKAQMGDEVDRIQGLRKSADTWKILGMSLTKCKIKMLYYDM